MNTPNTPSKPSPNAKVVLLVDDDKTTLMVLSKMLQGQGYRVLSASDGEQALTLAAQQQRLDLLITDVVMPKLNGTELAKRLRVNRPNIPILFISGLMGEGSLAGKQANSGFLAKPVTQEGLAAKLQNLLRGI